MFESTSMEILQMQVEDIADDLNRLGCLQQVALHASNIVESAKEENEAGAVLVFVVGVEGALWYKFPLVCSESKGRCGTNSH